MRCVSVAHGAHDAYSGGPCLSSPPPVEGGGSAWSGVTAWGTDWNPSVFLSQPRGLRPGRAQGLSWETETA